MRHENAAGGLPALFVAMLCAAASLVASAASLQPFADFLLPGSAGRFDYAAFDPRTGDLWLNQMGADRILVFDPKTRGLAAVVHDLSTPTGITLAPERRLAFVSQAGDLLARIAGRGRIAAVNLDSHRIVAQLPAGHFPDGSAWVPALVRLFVSDELGGTETVIGGDPLRALKTIPLGGEAGMSAYDPVSRRVLVNVQTKNQIVAIDPRSLRVAARTALPPTCQHNHGLLVDAADRLAFVACDGNARLLVLSLPELAAAQPPLELGKDPDVLALDVHSHRLIVAAESGVAAIFVVARGRVRPLWRGFVGPDAHVVAVDPQSSLLYFPLAVLHGKPVLRVMRVDADPARR